MSSGLMENLNKEQLEAVLHKEGPLLIVAGAGTGKTTVITQKIAYIIEQNWAKPDEILALTFTEKAAGEMAERVDRLLPIGYLDLWISTFHSFAERILKAHGLDIGLPSDFKLLNEFEQWILVKKNLDKFNLDYYRPAGNPAKFIGALLKHFSRLKDEDIGPSEYLEYAGDLKQNMDDMLSGATDKKKNSKSKITNSKQIQNSKSKIPNKSPLPPLAVGGIKGGNDAEIEAQEAQRVNELANAYHVYEQLLLDNNAMDFGGLINYCLKLFKQRPAILEKYRQQFKYILVDEFQDTNWAQYELVKMLAAPANNLTVVGDDDQSIYRFRGASMSNILQFKKDYPGAEQVALVKNYRNKQNILDLSYEFIKLNNPNRLEWQLNRRQITDNRQQKVKLNKKLEAQESGGGMIEVIRGEDLNEEVRVVVEKIADIKVRDKNSSWNDFAILVRANDAAKDFCAALDAAGLPYQFLASRGLYSRPVIMDIIAYLKLLDDYHESRAMYRVLNLPIFNFSHYELVNFNYWAGRKSWSLYEVLRNGAALMFDKDVLEKIDKVLSLIAKHTALVREKAVSEVILAFLSDSGYLKYLMSKEERKAMEAANYLNQFIKRVNAFESVSDDKSVKAFLEELNMEIDSGEEGALTPDMEAGPEAIKIMTVHGAKGLEFKYVFIANLVDKRFPTIERKEQIEIPDALVKEILPQGDIHLEEERRLFYVAMTRAREGLFFSWAPDYGGARKKKASRFLEETGLVKNKLEIRNSKLEIGEEITNSKFQITNKSKFSNHKLSNFQIPSYFSYTQLAAFSNCPYQYHFAHILRIPIRGKAIFSFGKTMHATLQKLFELVKERGSVEQKNLFGYPPSTPLIKGGKGGLRNAKISLDEILKLYEKNWIDDWYESKQQKEEYKKKGKEILKEFYEKHKENWPTVKFTEKGFNMKVVDGGEYYTIRGVIDRVNENNPSATLGTGKIKIIDYKTGQPKDKLSFEEKEQLLIYQLAAKDLFAEKVGSLAFYYLNNNSEMEFLGTEEELAKVKEKIIKTIGEIKKGEFPPRPSQLCKFCDFKDICEFRRN
ncbi:UvrD-helicase domain-containing protein [Candidatus Falkowbacteria bacterium]|nr:UvrD-helicase domain-containing protein [Candidatus Falkowbacteria bacterium]